MSLSEQDMIAIVKDRLMRMHGQLYAMANGLSESDTPWDDLADAICEVSVMIDEERNRKAGAEPVRKAA